MNNLNLVIESVLSSTIVAPQLKLSGKMVTINTDKQQARKQAEDKFEASLREYILNEGKQFAFGGVQNLVETVRIVLERLAEETRIIDYQSASDTVGSICDAVDLYYAEKY